MNGNGKRTPRTAGLRAALRWVETHAGLTDLYQDLDEGRWEILKTETVREDPAEREHIAYGFRCPYNDLIVGGLCELEVAQVLMEHRLVGSYVEQELDRQSF